MARLIVTHSKVVVQGLAHSWSIELPIDASSEEIMEAMKEARLIEAVVGQLGIVAGGFSNIEVRSGTERMGGHVVVKNSLRDVILRQMREGKRVMLCPVTALDPDNPETEIIGAFVLDVVEGGAPGAPGTNSLPVTVASRNDIPVGMIHMRRDWLDHIATLVERGEVQLEPAYIKKPDGTIVITEFSLVPGDRVLSRRASDKGNRE